MQSIWFEDKSYEVPKSIHMLMAAGIHIVENLRGDQRCEEELQKGMGMPVYNSMLNMISTIEMELLKYNPQP